MQYYNIFMPQLYTENRYHSDPAAILARFHICLLAQFQDVFNKLRITGRVQIVCIRLRLSQ